MKMFSWCLEGRHEECTREFQRFYIDPRKNTVVLLDEWHHCECRKRGCKCFVPKNKTRKSRRKS